MLGSAPDYLSIPVERGQHHGVLEGFKSTSSTGVCRRSRNSWGSRLPGTAPIVENRVIENPETIATAIRIGNPAGWKSAVAALDESAAP